LQNLRDSSPVSTRDERLVLRMELCSHSSNFLHQSLKISQETILDFKRVSRARKTGIVLAHARRLEIHNGASTELGHIEQLALVCATGRPKIAFPTATAWHGSANKFKLYNTAVSMNTRALMESFACLYYAHTELYGWMVGKNANTTPPVAPSD
jgi:hypothetical protein